MFKSLRAHKKRSGINPDLFSYISLAPAPPTAARHTPTRQHAAAAAGAAHHARNIEGGDETAGAVRAARIEPIQQAAVMAAAVIDLHAARILDIRCGDQNGLEFLDKQLSINTKRLIL